MTLVLPDRVVRDMAGVQRNFEALARQVDPDGGSAIDADIITRDNFTDAAGALLTAHVADTGDTWALHPVENAYTPVISDANRLRMGAAGTVNAATVMLDETPADPDVIISADCIPFTDDGTQYIGLWARLAPAAATGYLLQHQAANWTLYRAAAGVFTMLQAANREFNGYVEMSIMGSLTGNGGTAIVVRRNGHVMIDYEDNSAYTTNGRVGVRFGGRAAGDTNTTGKHLENLIVRKAVPWR